MADDATDVIATTIQIGLALIVFAAGIAFTIYWRNRKRDELRESYREKVAAAREQRGERDDGRAHSSEHFSERPRRPSVPAEVIEVVLKESAALRRLLEINTGESIFFVEYNGNGLGYETVLINGRVV